MILNNALLLLLLVLAVAAGWTLGRNGLRMDIADRSQLPSQYYRGFNFLLDGEEEDAVDAFTEALAVNEETLDTHIALGSVLRKRGEVDRAIRIHQNLLKRPQLSAVQLHQVHLELARDFIAAGLHDRAEQLLLDLAAQSTEFMATAQRHLLDVYESQRDWQSAEDIAAQLISRADAEGLSATGHGQPVQQLRCHYLCEQAELALERSEDALALSYYEEALRDQPQDLRAHLGIARWQLAQGDAPRALEHFDIVMGSGRSCTPELLELLRDICSAHSDSRLYLSSLERYYELQHSPLLALALAAELSRLEGREPADDFLRGSLEKYPSVSIAASLALTALRAESTGPELEVLERLLSDDEGYQCDHCGFTGRARHWRCPGCRHWDSIHYRGGALERLNA